MAHAPSTIQAPLTEAAFLADRMSFWSGFCNFVVIVSGLLVLMLILMAIFLV